MNCNVGCKTCLFKLMQSEGASFQESFCMPGLLHSLVDHDKPNQLELERCIQNGNSVWSRSSRRNAPNTQQHWTHLKIHTKEQGNMLRKRAVGKICTLSFYPVTTNWNLPLDFWFHFYSGSDDIMRVWKCWASWTSSVTCNMILGHVSEKHQSLWKAVPPSHTSLSGQKT